MIITLAQFSPTDNIEENITEIETLLTNTNTGEVIVLPEMWSFMVPDSRSAERFATIEKYEALKAKMSSWAKAHKALLIGGSIFAPSSVDTKIHNRCLVFNEQGQEIASYDKIHLFDNELNKTNPFQESASILAGEKTVCFKNDSITYGLSICYDLRFPYHFQALTENGASIIFIPSAFTKKTGKAHWETLIKARAIENQCFIVACNQTGSTVKGVDCYGHSMIINPWGDIVANLEEATTASSFKIDFSEINTVRTQMPTLSHRKHNVTKNHAI